jgi:hypothetical protein
MCLSWWWQKSVTLSWPFLLAMGSSCHSIASCENVPRTYSCTGTNNYAQQSRKSAQSSANQPSCPQPATSSLWTGQTKLELKTPQNMAWGVIIGKNKACTPTVFRIEWSEDIKQDIQTHDNPTWCLTNSDLEMAGLLFLWLVMGEVCRLSAGCHVVLFSNNSPTVSWFKWLASKGSMVAPQLLRVLALRLKAKQACPLTPFHVVDCEHLMTNIPSCLWGS